MKTYMKNSITKEYKSLHFVIIVMIVIPLIFTSCGSNRKENEGFGASRFGYIEYNGKPYYKRDIQVNIDGILKKLEYRTHNIEYDQLKWLLDSRLECLIIGTGWGGQACLGFDAKKIKVQMLQIKTEGAIKKYQELIKNGKKVAIHIHSTC